MVTKARSVPRVVGKVALSLLSVVALAATGYGFVTYHKVQSDVHISDVLDLPADVKAPPSDDGAEDILLVGTDARTDMRGNALPSSVLKQLRTEQSGSLNTDTLIILRIPKSGGKATATSIPRDTWVDIPQSGQAKINSVYAVAKAAAAEGLRGKEDVAAVERDSDQAGRKELVQTVQDFTQVRIDHYAEVNLLGFYLITEALGGVQVCLNHATEDKDSGADFRAGLRTISGGDALSFVRQRKNLPRGDLDRIVRQQAFLSSALHKVLTAGTLTNPSTMGNLTNALGRSLVLDPGFDLLQLAQKARGLASGDVSFDTIPVITINGWSPDGKQSIVQVDPDAVRQYFAGLAGRGSTGSGGGASGGVAPAAYDTPLARTSVDGVQCVN
ncbi:MAG TPA: LCP family protein [Amycolatopsis sp.]|nr:LCP family protein [Amycolatopsis sp.]HKS46051.1 LCP family protein [Amycolatopsis sp.]